MLTKGGAGGNITERLNEAAVTRAGKSRSEAYAERTGASAAKDLATRIQRNLKKGVDKGNWLWYYETPAASWRCAPCKLNNVTKTRSTRKGQEVLSDKQLFGKALKTIL